MILERLENLSTAVGHLYGAAIVNETVDSA
jgi:hypothetical protein